MGEEVRYVRQDEVLELESEQRIPPWELLKRGESEKSVFDRSLSWLDGMEIESRIVVAYSDA